MLTPWLEWLKLHLHNVFTDSPWEKAITYDNGHHSSIIDYIFISKDRQRFAVNAHNHVLPSSWSDHRLLTFELEQPDKSGTGPGTWRMNPLLLESIDFTATLHLLLDQLHEHFNRSKTVSIQVQWDIVKDAIQTLAVQEGKRQKTKLNRQLLSAESRRKHT
jgi:hypothetical protein